ncbi:MAG: 16S rRNA (guanine527-N7)-methyltransferase [bacterium P3]|nr:MAG: 16S rRNA (guanine527-N7)-methyltransferase [bacterium P3]KWW41853.1 MAG: 16S rRNA (guanine527-N7)-methyltransferase [bacterium F083]
MERILHYFPVLTPLQRGQFAALLPLYKDWNAKINVISRRDMDLFYEHHVLHSLAIARVQSFLPGARILDVGTGGGFPGIPLAILHPDTSFLLVDSIGKKIRVVQDVVRQLGLKNVQAIQTRAEQVDGTFDFVVSRAVTALPEFAGWVRGRVAHQHRHALPNGIICLKGGELSAELAPFRRCVTVYDISRYFDESYFETKKVIHLPL